MCEHDHGHSLPFVRQLLYTSIIDEHEDFDNVLAKLQLEKDVMLGPVDDYMVRRRAVNDMLLARIHKIFDSPWYTGETTPGIRKGRPPRNRSSLAPMTNSGELDNEDEMDAAEEVDDAEEANIGGVMEYISDLST
jgi:hypothetical protein